MKRISDDCYMADDESIALINVSHRNTKQSVWIVLNKKGDLLYGPDEDESGGVMYMRLMEKSMDLNRKK